MTGALFIRSDNMAIQFRRGNETDLIAEQLLSAEPAFTTDTKTLFIGDGEGSAIQIKPTRTARIVIGTSSAGWTRGECDYLCDGTADQTEINAAIQALPSNGGEIILLDGDYYVSAPILINKNYITIRGNGKSVRLRRAWSNPAETEGIITLSSVQHCELINLALRGIASSYDGIGICFNGSHRNIITNVRAIENRKKAIQLNGSNYNIIKNNFYSSLSGASQPLIYLNSSNYNQICENCCEEGTNGIQLYNSDYNDISNNVLYNNPSGGIMLKTSSNNNITGNVCCNTGYAGVYLTDTSRHNAITANTCNDNNVGIYFYDSSCNVITGNACNNNNTGIYLQGSSTNTISGNTCIRGGGLSGDYSADQYTIRLNGTGNNYNLIIGNNCMGKAVAIDGGTGNTNVNNKYN